MKIKPLFLLLFLLDIINGFPQTQTFYNSYSSYGGSVMDIKKTYDNNLILLIDGTNSSTFYFVKMDTLGNVLWQAKLITPYTQTLSSVIQTTDSGYVALIQLIIGGTGYIAITKIDKNGNFLWAKKYNQSGSNTGYSLVPLENGGFAFSGGGCSGQNYIMKLDVNGSIIWQKQYRDFSVLTSFCDNIIHNSDHSLVLAGVEGTNSHQLKLMLFSVDSSGNLLWYKEFVYPQMSYCHGLLRSNDKGYTITGHTNAVDSTQQCPFILHTDSLGNFQWAKYYSHNLQSYPYGIVQLSSGEYAVSGYIVYNDSRNTQMLNFKTDATGNLIWAHSAGNVAYSGKGADWLYCSAWVASNSFYAAGWSDYSVLMKLDSSGKGTCNYDTVTYHPSAITVTQVTPTITILPVSFTSDTTTYIYYSSTFTKTTYCSTTGYVEDKANGNSLISIFPNPTSGKFTVSIRNYRPRAKDQIEVYNMMGEMVYNKNLTMNSGQCEIDLSNQPAGIYLYRITNAQGHLLKTDRIVIAR